MRKVFAACLIAFGVGACAQMPRVVGQPYFATAIPFCQMMADTERYLDREVLVSGLYIATPHGGRFYGEDCETADIGLRGTVDLPHNQGAWRIVGRASKKVHGARVPIVAKGVLKAWPGPGITTTDNQYWLERTQVLAADGEHVIRPPA
jgi:hypothetical protein